VNPVLCSGSVAWDYILTFAGRFREHILPDSVHVLNLSFLVDRFERRRGGVAANYAYNLRLLGAPAAVLATAGDDAADYRRWLEELGVDCAGLRLLEGEHTATGFTTTDLDDNQITGYYGGAMNRAGELGLQDAAPDPAALIIGPNAPAAMKRLVGEARAAGMRFVFDPAHQLPHLGREDLLDGARGAWVLIGNDYELRLITERTGMTVEGLLELCEVVVTTLGREGSRIDTREGAFAIPPAPPARLVDPTGAGDAYRAGLVAALLAGCEVSVAGRVASLAATYAVEQGGTIEHRYTLADFAARYAAAFGQSAPAAFSA
jgi:adenosine kinase